MNPPFKLYKPIGIIAVLPLAVSFLYPGPAFTVHLYDTYFVMDQFYLYTRLSGLMLITALIYTLTGDLLYSPLLTLLHTGLTVLALLTFVTTSYFLPRYPADFSSPDIDLRTLQLLTGMPVLAVTLLLAAQIPFLINITAGLALKRKAV